jgi:hypothetical protein
MFNGLLPPAKDEPVSESMSRETFLSGGSQQGGRATLPGIHQGRSASLLAQGQTRGDESNLNAYNTMARDPLQSGWLQLSVC